MLLHSSASTRGPAASLPRRGGRPSLSARQKIAAAAASKKRSIADFIREEAPLAGGQVLRSLAEPYAQEAHAEVHP
jgi:hypothetical protein